MLLHSNYFIIYVSIQEKLHVVTANEAAPNGVVSTFEKRVENRLIGIHPLKWLTLVNNPGEHNLGRWYVLLNYFEVGALEFSLEQTATLTKLFTSDKW